ncbi:MAG: hypothetical protein RIB54_03280 [Fulvivirga sp.]|uniref:hypothetical protein n=1 Tax=Fulvivirga sp. TaxID=1931237 RepID=UPI0032ED7C2E
MNINELKKTWDNLHQKGLESQTESEIQKIIVFGTSEVVSTINKKLFRDMAITAFASVVSAFGVIFFYLAFDPVKHPWIDLSKLVPIQVLAFVLFFVLFLFGWLEYKLVNRKFTSESVKAYISTSLVNLKKYSRLFMTVILLLLLGTFFLELNYFFVGEGFANMLFKTGGSILLTAISYAIIRRYYKKGFGSYLADLSSYQKELES